MDISYNLYFDCKHVRYVVPMISRDSIKKVDYILANVLILCLLAYVTCDLINEYMFTFEYIYLSLLGYKLFTFKC